MNRFGRWRCRREQKCCDRLSKLWHTLILWHASGCDTWPLLWFRHRLWHTKLVSVKGLVPTSRVFLVPRRDLFTCSAHILGFVRLADVFYPSLLILIEATPISHATIQCTFRHVKCHRRQCHSFIFYLLVICLKLVNPVKLVNLGKLLKLDLWN